MEIPHTGQKRVFISHSSRDEHWVRTHLAGALRDRNLAVSVSHEFDPRRGRDTNIADGIDSSDYFLAVLTDFWFESDWCLTIEYGRAKTLNKTICAVQKEAIRQKHKDSFLPSWIDLSTPEKFTSECERLFEALGVGSRNEGAEALPLPTAPYDPVGPPTSMTAVSLLPVECPNAPFDIGTIWGLPRFGLIGLLSAPAHVRILETLVRAERAVLDAQFQRLVGRLPDRWWVECSMHAYPNGPHTLNHVWTCAQRVVGAEALADNILAGYLKRCGLHQAMRFGCVLTVSRAEEISSAEQWCRRLIDLIPDVAVVVQITLQTLAASSNAALGLAEALGRLRVPVPIEVYEWRGSHQDTFAATIGLEPERWPASGDVGTWLGLALQRATAAELGRLQAVLRLIGAVPAAAAERRPRPSDTVAALDAEGVPATVYREFLWLVSSFVPERMDDLLRAFGASTRLAAHREALIAASLNDGWMDAYVSGVNWQSTEALNPSRYPAGRVGSGADGVALALLRRLDRAPGPHDPTRAAIGQLSRWVCPCVKLLCLAALESSAAIPASGADPADWLALARSGLPLGAPLASVISTRDDVGLSWWLSATSPRVEALEALLQTAAERRAVFGLVMAAELEPLASDASLLRDTEEKRRRRPLPIRVQPRGGSAHVG